MTVGRSKTISAVYSGSMTSEIWGNCVKLTAYGKVSLVIIWWLDRKFDNWRLLLWCFQYSNNTIIKLQQCHFKWVLVSRAISHLYYGKLLIVNNTVWRNTKQTTLNWQWTMPINNTSNVKTLMWVSFENLVHFTMFIMFYTLLHT